MKYLKGRQMRTSLSFPQRISEEKNRSQSIEKRNDAAGKTSCIRQTISSHTIVSQKGTMISELMHLIPVAASNKCPCLYFFRSSLKEDSKQLSVKPEILSLILYCLTRIGKNGK